MEPRGSQPGTAASSDTSVGAAMREQLAHRPVALAAGRITLGGNSASVNGRGSDSPGAVSMTRVALQGQACGFALMLFDDHVVSLRRDQFLDVSRLVPRPEDELS
jgi:hypothetical protein